MIDNASLINLINRRVNRILNYAELAVPSDKFERFRSLVLDEFGHTGLRTDLAELLDRGDQGGNQGKGMGRNQSGKKGGAS